MVIRVAVAAPIVIVPAPARPETRATETPVVTEVAASPGKVRTRKAAAATGPTPPMAATESTAHMAATESTAHMAAAESAAHMTAAAEPATVSTPATMSTAASTTTAARKRISGQSPSESGSHSQNNHGL